MSLIENTSTLEQPVFSWKQEIRSLLRVQSIPASWWRAAIIVYAVDVFVIVGCIVGSKLIHGNTDRMFGEKQPGTLASVAALAGAGIVCLRIRKRLLGTPLAAFWRAFGILMCLATADDLFQIHERLDRVIHAILLRDGTDRITDHLDDLIVGMYALPAAYFGLRYRKHLIEARLTLQVLAVAFVIFAAHLAFDVLGGSQAAEESLKLTAACTIMLAFLATLLQPTLPVSWTKSIAETPEIDDEVEDIAVSLATSRRWVRITGMTVFVAMFCVVVAAVFTYSAATRNPEASHQLLFKISTLLLIFLAGGLFWTGHYLFLYAAQIGVTSATAVWPARRQERAQAGAWRAAGAASIGTLLVMLILAVWACRLYVPRRGTGPRPVAPPPNRLANEME